MTVLIKKEGIPVQNNFVAKHARQFNKCAVFADRKRKAKNGVRKHKGNF